MSRGAAIVALLLPMAVMAQDPAGDTAGPEFLTLEELCENRSDPDYWAEIERRKVFRGRELRAIQEQKPLTGITQETLFCFMGRPTYIYALIDEPRRDYVEAYAYELGENRILIVHVRHRDDKSTVIRAFESDAIEVESSYWSHSRRAGRDLRTMVLRDLRGPLGYSYWSR